MLGMVQKNFMGLRHHACNYSESVQWIIRMAAALELR